MQNISEVISDLVDLIKKDAMYSRLGHMMKHFRGFKIKK